ncbi:MAG: bifunctional hydroxymethylpyrimidine kinase/phosphomethylpyrimidine kinase [Planctomycetes bacterium]|nr:bifunctional hydroxymethylpyrimidine kinase/phosphomethylpyrimidine kinase [Planctomycetota bacterium]
MASFPPVCLTIGVSDSSGGAGIQADLKTFTALQCYGASVVTGVTAQNFTSIQTMFAVPEQYIRAQLDAIESELAIDAVKVGLCPSAASMRVVARWLRERPKLHVLVDPVAADSRGIALLQPEVVEVLRAELLPRATLATPNRFEAALLMNMDECLDIESMEAAAKGMLHTHGCATLVTGGNMGARSLDVLAAIDGLRHFDAETIIRSTKIHGVGCAHSAAIAANLAKGESLRESVLNAKAYVSAAIAAAPELENGHAVFWHGVTVKEQVMASDASGAQRILPE